MMLTELSTFRKLEEEQSGTVTVENEYEMPAKYNPAYEEVPASQPPMPPPLSQQSLSDGSECNQQSETSIVQPAAEGSNKKDTCCTEGVDEAADQPESQMN